MKGHHTGRYASTDKRLLELWATKTSKRASARRRELKRDRRKKDRMPRKRIWGRTMIRKPTEDDKKGNKIEVFVCLKEGKNKGRRRRSHRR